MSIEDSVVRAGGPSPPVGQLIPVGMTLSGVVEACRICHTCTSIENFAVRAGRPVPWLDDTSLATWLLRIPPCGLVKRSPDWIVFPLVHDDGVRAFPASRLGGGLGENAVSSNTKLPGQGVGPSYLGWPEGEAGPSASPGNLTSARYSARYSAFFVQ
ncbi:unnamed protein product [Prunus armeniaca]